MARKKKNPKAIHNRANQAAANIFHDQQRRLPPKPVIPARAPSRVTLSPSPSPPPQPSYNEIRRQHLGNFRTTVKAALMPLSDHGDDDLLPLNGDNTNDNDSEDDEVLAERVRNLWHKMGYYTNHPDHNAANASEDHVKELLATHHKLGPVLKKYKLLINPPKMHSLLLQFPARHPTVQYRASKGRKPLEMRWKPKCGLVEVDIPLNIHSNYNKEKGIQYGEGLRNSRVLQQGGSHGFPGGMGVGFKPSKDDKRANLPEGPTSERLLENFDDANNKGHVMNKITLGGQIVPFQDGDPIYMIATFHEATCTWTRLDAMVKLSPNFNHIDALHEQDKAAARKDGASERKAANNSNGKFDEESDEEPNEKADEKADESQPKAVNKSVKSAENKEDDDMYGNMRETAKLLEQMRDEPWQRLTWVDQDDDESFEVYDENLVYRDPENAPMLMSELTEEQYLDAISCPRIDPKKEADKFLLAGKEATVKVDDDTEEESELDLADTEDEQEDQKEEKDDLPPGIIRPDDFLALINIETMARMICSKFRGHDDCMAEAHLRKKTRGQKNYYFLDLRNRHYPYFQWRLAENRAGRGRDPEVYMPPEERQHGRPSHR